MNAYFIFLELIIYILFGLSLAHAWRKGVGSLQQLVAGVLFGLLLEWATIQQLQAYEYGRFLLMLGPVPLAIGVAWGVIIYSARLYSDATSLPGWARPLLDGLLALSIDLSMDTLAIRLGFWKWGIPLDSQFFGVPYANFWAWFWVVFFFSTGARRLSGVQHPLAKWLAPLGAVITGVVGVLATNRLIVSIPVYALYVGVIVTTLGAVLALVLAQRPRLQAQPESLAAWVPLVFHAYYLVAGTLSGIFASMPALLALSLAMALLSLLLHARFFRRILTRVENA